MPGRRTIIKIIALLVTGAVINVAVAWGIAWSHEHGVKRARQNAPSSWSCIPDLWEMDGTTTVWRVWIWRGIGAIEIEQYGGTCTGGLAPEEFIASLPEWSDFRLGVGMHARHCAVDSTGFSNTSREFATGWPRSVFKYCQRATFRAATRDRSQMYHAFGQPEGSIAIGKLLPGSWRDDALLPVIPLWPGFAVNTLFYAGVLWMVFAFPGALRRMFRRRRGRCAACAYPIGQSPVCTECGAVLQPRGNASRSGRPPSHH